MPGSQGASGVSTIKYTRVARRALLGLPAASNPYIIASYLRNQQF